MDNATKTAIDIGYHKCKKLYMQRTIKDYLQEAWLEQYLESRNVQHND